MQIVFLLLLLLFSYNSYAQHGKNESTVMTKSKQQEQSSTLTIAAHNPTYFVPFSYNSKIQEYDIYGRGPEPLPLEFEYQISFKMAIFDHIAHSNTSLYLAYTQLSFWQSYNFEEGTSFRETNYEPELFIQWDGDIKLSEHWRFSSATIGVTHQSNGCSRPLARSWNRLESRLSFASDNFLIIVNPWWRFHETASRDVNPDITDYLGHGKITAAYQWGEHTFSLISRNNLESGFSKGSIKGSWSFPIHGKIRGYVQAFSGYGNSLIEYNQYTNTVGVGFSIVDWF